MEINFGDNDTLSAIAAGMVHADYLFLMTDVDCLYDKNPRTNPDAKPIQVIEDTSQLQADVSSRGSSLGTGGMSTKLVAAGLATSAGVTTVIAASSRPGNIRSIVNYIESQKGVQNDRASTLTTSIASSPRTAPSPLRNGTADPTSPNAPQIPPSSASSSAPEAILVPPLHTRFLPNQQPIRDRYFWLLHGLTPYGSLYIDQGAYAALVGKAGLFPVGVVDVEGSFAQQECVRVFVVQRLARARSSSYSLPTSTEHGIEKGEEKGYVWTEEFGEAEVGRAIVNYSSVEIKRIMGLKRSDQIRDVLGYADCEYIAFRHNIAFLKLERSRPVTPTMDNVPAMTGSFPLPQ
jgi:glutamate 5-kinase